MSVAAVEAVEALEALEALAIGQLGLFTRDQALGNISGEALRWHTQPGRRWRRVAPGVYWVVARDRDWRAPHLASLLWAGEPAVLSHRSAGALHLLDGVVRDRVEFCTPRSTRPPARWTRHLRAVDPARVVTDGLLRFTAGRQTLVDLAEVLDDTRLEWALESALRQRLVTLDALCGAPPSLRRVLELRPSDAPATGSIRETQFVQLARTVAVPPLERQVAVGDRARFPWRIDLAWPDVGVFVEIDGRWHDDEDVKPYDRHRQNDIILRLGWRPLRVGSDDILKRPTYTARLVEDFYRRALTWAS